MKEIVERVRRLRQASGMSQQDLAVRAGMHQQAVARLELGKVGDPHLSTLEKLAEALGVSFFYLYTGEEFEPPPKASAPPRSGQQRQQQERDPIDELVRLLREDDEATARRVLVYGGAPEGWVYGVMLPALKYHVGEVMRLLREVREVAGTESFILHLPEEVPETFSVAPFPGDVPVDVEEGDREHTRR